jgi:sigma-B regulation protein RsbQ
MTTERRHNVHIAGEGPVSMVFAHGFGCDQSMWRFIAPSFEDRYRTIVYDLVGSGKSDLSAYDRDKYASLHGHADDLVEIIEACSSGPTIFVGHSVSGMIGALASIARPDLFASLLMIGPSPCYINDGSYVGGFNRPDIDDLLETLESNYLGWSSTMAPAIMGAPDRPEFAQELTNSFCRTDPEIAKHFARVTFLSDHRADLYRVSTPSLVVQCSHDLIAPVPVGEYMHRTMPKCMLRVIQNVGHCPHVSAPGASLGAMHEFLAA